jgi:hypothetical protein
MKKKARSATQEMAITLSAHDPNGVHVGLLIVGDQGSYYNASNAPNYMSRQ